MIICPNFSNPEVAREFEELKNATSEAAAYHIWSLNNGNTIDKAPNGAESKLFTDLLQHYKGDRVKAIQTKAKVYGMSFLNSFGNWVNDNYKNPNSVDENGEPLINNVFNTAANVMFSVDTRRARNIEILLDDYLDRTIEQRQQKRSGELLHATLIKHRLDKTNFAFYDNTNADDESVKNSNVQKTISKYTKEFEDAGIPNYMYKIYPVPIGRGGVKIQITIRDLENIQRQETRQLRQQIEELSNDEINSRIALLEQEDRNYGGMMFYINKNRLPEIRQNIEKKLTEITQYYENLVDTGLQYLESLPQDDTSRLFVNTALRWFKLSPLQKYDLQALFPLFELARKYNVDIQQLKSPIDLIEFCIQHDNRIKDSDVKVDAASYPGIQYSHSITNDDGIEIQVFDVENSSIGQQSVSQILHDTSATIDGKHINYSPWCLSTYNYDENNIAHPGESAEHYWENYSKAKRQIAMVDGKPIAFNSSGHKDVEWWDFLDHSHAENLEDVKLDIRIPGFKKWAVRTGQDSHAVDYRYSFGNYVYNTDQNSLQFRDRGLGIEATHHTTGDYTIEFLTPDPVNVSTAQDRGIVVAGEIDVISARMYISSSYGAHFEFSLNDYQGRYQNLAKLHPALLKSVLKSIEKTVSQSAYTMQKYGELHRHDYSVSPIVENGPSFRDRKFVFKAKPTFLFKETKHEDFSTSYMPIEPIENLLQAVITNFTDASKDFVDRRTQLFDIKKLFEHKQNIFRQLVKTLDEIDELIASDSQIIEQLEKATNIIHDVEQQMLSQRLEEEAERNPDLVFEDKISTQIEHEYERREDQEDEAVVNLYEQTTLSAIYNREILNPVNKDLEKHLAKILKRFHFKIITTDVLQDVFGRDKLSAFDFLQKIIYLTSENERNAVNFPEEFCHAFIKMMGSAYHRTENRERFPETKLYSELRDMIEHTDIYAQTLEDYQSIYVYPNGGQPNLPAIKEEALGKALTAALLERASSRFDNDKSFLQKLKEWFTRIIQWFKKRKIEAEKEAGENLEEALNKIADSILDGSYFEKYLKKLDDKGYKKVGFKETIKHAKNVDGGKGYGIARYFSSIGGVISGSLAYRYQGTVYRKKLDTLHDIDVSFSSSDLQYAFDHTTPQDHIYELVQNEPLIQRIKEQYRDFDIVSAFYTDNKLIVNGMICEDRALFERFCSMTGNFNSRMEQFTEEEHKKIYLVDLFFNDVSDFVHHYSTGEGADGLYLANYTVPFKEKLKFSRAKDLYDYQNFNPYKRDIDPRITESASQTQQEFDNSSSITYFKDYLKSLRDTLNCK